MSGLKAQQSIAQGNALGRQTAASAPCKGKSIRNQAIMKDTFALTGRIHNMPVTSPQGVALGYGLLPLQGVLNTLITNYMVHAKLNQ